MIRWPASLHCAILAILGTTCVRGEPPTFHDAEGGSESVARIPPLPAGDAAPERSGIEEDASAWPQTRERPSSSGARFNPRFAALADAIVSGDPDRGMEAFFPPFAYVQVKAIANPRADYEHRLVRNFRRDVLAAHKQIVAHRGAATMLGIDVPDDRARWIEPGEESNKVGYFRVYGSKMRFQVDGKPLTVEIASLISWRGEWYVVHLNGFR